VDVVLDNLSRYRDGFTTTVSVTAAAFGLALVVGTVVAAFRVSPVPPLRWAGVVYVESFRNTPLTVLFVLFFFGLPYAGVVFDAYPCAVLVLGLYTGAFVAETVRSGINTVAAGQAEAARALGLTFPQVLVLVILPQAVRTVVAPLGSLLIACTKNSAIATVISVFELTKIADLVGNETARPVPALLGAAAGYLVLTLPAGLLFGVVERRVAIKR
jgi:glutamate transport system permease protein